MRGEFIVMKGVERDGDEIGSNYTTPCFIFLFSQQQATLLFLKNRQQAERRHKGKEARIK